MTARLPKHQRNQVIGVLMAGSTVNDIAHHFGCFRQTIHYFMTRYNKTGYVRFRAKPGRARVATIIARLYGVHAQMIISHFVQINGPGIFQHENARPHTTRK